MAMKMWQRIRMKLVDRADIPWVHSKIPWGPIDKCVVYTWLSDTYTYFDEKLQLVNETNCTIGQDTC